MWNGYFRRGGIEEGSRLLFCLLKGEGSVAPSGKEKFVERDRVRLCVWRGKGDWYVRGGVKDTVFAVRIMVGQGGGPLIVDRREAGI